MSEEWPDDDARFTGPGCRLDEIGGVASGRAFKPDPPPFKEYLYKAKDYASLVSLGLTIALAVA